jgi:hypothetical protein
MVGLAKRNRFNRRERRGGRLNLAKIEQKRAKIAIKES